MPAQQRVNLSLPQLEPQSCAHHTPQPHIDDTPKEKCGVFGVWNHPTPATACYYGIYALQHRGQESAGIAVTDRNSIQRHVGMGLVANVFNATALNTLDTIANSPTEDGQNVGGAIGHNRYSTTGSSEVANAQPMLSHINFGATYSGGGVGPVAIAHNGNIVNAVGIRRELEGRGHPFQTSSDTEVVLHLLADAAAAGETDPLGAALRRLVGAFNLVLLFKDRIEAARDPWGWRPLVLGQTEDGAYVVASETVALEVSNAKYIREIEPGEIITISDKGLESRRYVKESRTTTPNLARCIFEHVYLASPASRVFGKTVQLTRELMGERLAQESPVEADWIIPMPDSGRSSAVGFSRASGIPFREGIIPNRYVGRSFIKPTGAQRATAVKLKINVVEEAVRGQRVVIVDDSIVRGTTTKTKMNQLKEAGAKEIHLRIASPPITDPCFFGIDFASKDELIAVGRDEEQIAKELGIDSVRYLTAKGLHAVVSGSESKADGYCDACFTGNYPVPITDATSRDAMGC